MNKHIAILCASICVGLCIPQLSVQAEQLFDTPKYSGRDPEEHPILAPCGRFDRRYQHLLFADKKLEDWPEMYHTKVNAVIEEYLKPAKIECDAESYDALSEPGDELLELAASLPTWNDQEVPLSRLDTSRVLLEYLRIYECALMEFDEFLYYDTRQEEYDDRGDSGFLKYFLSDLMNSTMARSETIVRERAVARTALHRAITIMGAFDRLGPLDAELECMQRFSLDMRNIAALSAETSACLPRIWNAKDSLRDINEE